MPYTSSHIPPCFFLFVNMAGSEWQTTDTWLHCDTPSVSLFSLLKNPEGFLMDCELNEVMGDLVQVNHIVLYMYI